MHDVVIVSPLALCSFSCSYNYIDFLFTGSGVRLSSQEGATASFISNANAH